jgi:hypothetical protein
MSDPAERPGERGVLRTLGMIAALALGGAAVFMVVVAHTQKQVQIGLLVGLWAALLGAFTLFGPRRGAAEPGRGVMLAGADRSPAQRREDELQLEVMLRREMERVLRTELAQLRGEVAGLREDLVENGQGELRLERIETTRLIGSEDLQHEVRRVAMAHSPAAAALEGGPAYPPATVVETGVKNSAPLPYVYGGQSGRDRATPPVAGAAPEPSLPASALTPAASAPFGGTAAPGSPETTMLFAPDGSGAPAATPRPAEPPSIGTPPSAPFWAAPPGPSSGSFDPMPPRSTAGSFDAMAPRPASAPSAALFETEHRPESRPSLPAPARAVGDHFPSVPPPEHGPSVLPHAQPSGLPPEPAPHAVSPLEALRASLAEPPAAPRSAAAVFENPLDGMPRLSRFDDNWDEPTEHRAASQAWDGDLVEWPDRPQSPPLASGSPAEPPMASSQPRTPQSYVGRRRSAVEGGPGYPSQPSNAPTPYRAYGDGRSSAPPSGSANGAPYGGTYPEGAFPSESNGVQRNGASSAHNRGSEPGPIGGRRRRTEGELDDVLGRMLRR